MSTRIYLYLLTALVLWMHFGIQYYQILEHLEYNTVSRSAFDDCTFIPQIGFDWWQLRFTTNSSIVINCTEHFISTP